MPVTSGPSRLALYAVAEEGGCEPVKAMLKSCMDELKTGAYSNDDLGRAKSVISGRSLAKKESNLGKAWTAGVYDVMGLGQEYGANFDKQVEKLGKSELASVSGRYLGKCCEVDLKPRNSSY